MVLLVTTPTGNTGKHVLAAALAAQEPTRVLVRDPQRLDPDLLASIEVVQGDLRNRESLRRALTGIDTAFYCVPQSADAPDVGAYYREFSEPFAAEAASAGLRRVVTVSGGDDSDDARGPGAALRDTERALNTVVGAARHIRCGYFMENLLWQAQTIAHAAKFTLPLPPHVPLAWIAAQDIGAAAAELMLDDSWSKINAVEAYGPTKLTCTDAAKVLTAALEFNVVYEATDPNTWVNDLQRYGVGAAMATSLKDMFAEIEHGRDMGGTAHNPVKCPTTLQTWAQTSLRPVIEGIEQH